MKKLYKKPTFLILLTQDVIRVSDAENEWIWEDGELL